MTRPSTHKVLCFRVVAGAWLVGWFWKAGFYAGYFLDETFAYPLDHEGFPAIFEHPAVSAAAWLAPALAAVALIVPRTAALRAAATVMTLCAFALCVHLEGFSDATFVTSFWVGVWLSWLAWRDDADGESFRLHARVLGQCVVGFVFLGPALGKLTDAYTGGEAFYQLYFLGKDNWPYPQLRATLSPESLRAAATWFSRGAIAAELALVLSPLVPSRLFAPAAAALLVGMTVVSTFYLVSVTASLVGICTAVFLLTRGPEQNKS